MKASDLRSKSVEELQKELISLWEEQFKRRTQKAVGQLTQTHLLRAAKRDIARIKTVLKEKAGN